MLTLTRRNKGEVTVGMYESMPMVFRGLAYSLIADEANNPLVSSENFGYSGVVVSWSAKDTDELEIFLKTPSNIPGILLVDKSLGLPNLNGLGLPPLLPKVIVWGDDFSLSEIQHFLGNAVLGLALRTTSLSDLMGCLLAVADDKVSIQTGVWPNKRRNVLDNPSLLSKREQEVVDLVVKCLTNRQISEKLGISEQTVKNHLHSIFNKTGVKSRMELASLFFGGETERDVVV